MSSCKALPDYHNKSSSADYQSFADALHTWNTLECEDGPTEINSTATASVKRPLCIDEKEHSALYPQRLFGSNTKTEKSSRSTANTSSAHNHPPYQLDMNLSNGNKILTTALLTKDSIGRHYDRNRKRLTEVQVERGTLIRSISMLKDDDILRRLKESYRDEPFCKEPLFMKCLDVSDVYLKVPSSEILLLSDSEASILLAIRDNDIRYDFHRDSSRFAFVDQLQKGDRVLVEIMETSPDDWPGVGYNRRRMYVPGWIEWIGEAYPREGTKFGVRLQRASGNMDGVYRDRRLFNAPHNGAVLVTGDALWRPFDITANNNPLSDPPFYSASLSENNFCTKPKNTSSSIRKTPVSSSLRDNEFESAPVVRNIPIRMVSTIDHYHRQQGKLQPAQPPSYSSLFGNAPSDTSFSNDAPKNVPKSVSPPSIRLSRSFAPQYSPSHDTPSKPPAMPHSHSSTNTASSSNIINNNNNNEQLMCVPRAGPSSSQSIASGTSINIPINISASNSNLDLKAVQKSSSSNKLNKSSSSNFFDAKNMNVITNNISTSTISMPNCCGLCNGDRIVWFDRDGIPRHGTVKWTGRLKGHSNIYVGVDFDEEIGGGTGRYQGLELFRTALNHAGLLPLSACMKESDMPADNAINSPPPLSPFGCSDNKSSDHQTDIRNRSDDYDSIRISNDAPLKYFGVDYDNTPININNNNINDVSQPQFTVGSCVDVDYRNERRFGVVKWIGYLSDVDERNNVKSVAVEIEGSIPNGWPLDIDLESSFNSLTKMYDHSNGPVTIVPISSLQPDNRFATPIVSDNINDDNCDLHLNGSKFGTLDGGVELNPCQPTRNIESLIGRMKGIQGYRNSCYLDATLYAMFAQSSAFDSILESRDTITDHSRRELVRILATEIVYPLRKFHFVRADHIYKLRQLLEKLLPEMSGLTSDEKDPEEVLIALFDKVLQVKPFLQLRNINDGTTDPAYICPLITEDLWSGEQRLLITVQSIVERSLFASNIQFAKDPKVLILQLPRYGRQKVFDKIIPQQELDITHLVFDSKRPCTICGKCADWICPECFLTKEVLLSDVTYCAICYEKAHLGYDHQPQPIKRSSSYNSNANRSSQNPNADQRHATLTSSITSTLTSSLTTRRSSIIPSRKLQLSAVLCIEMSHYVTFIRTNTLNKWLMFDSMADRVGLSDGYNVPEVKQCNKMSQWLSESGIAKIRSSLEKDSRLPTEVESDMQMNRFISDCYVCIYTYDEQQQQSDKKIDPMALAARLFAKNQFDA